MTSRESAIVLAKALDSKKGMEIKISNRKSKRNILIL